MAFAPARPGIPVSEIETPALIVDLDRFEANLDRMSAFCRAAGVLLRPHGKTHKSPVVANLQVALGASGVCVQKVGEAEVMAWGGVRDILVSNEVVSAAKIARLAGLTRFARITLCADAAGPVDLMQSVAARFGTTLGVLVEIECGGERCGVATPAEALALAQRIEAAPNLVFRGVQAYDGTAQHLRSLAEREARVAGAVDRVQATLAALSGAGLSCEIVGGGGTGTFPIEAASGVYTELQAGSYVFMDGDYGRNDPAPDFDQALFVLATVMSAPEGAGRVVLDCGHKGIPIDSGLPQVFGRDDLVCTGLSDEHASFSVSEGAPVPARGERLWLVPGHCDPAVNCHDWFVGVRGGLVEAVWPVAARGAMS